MSRSSIVAIPAISLLLAVAGCGPADSDAGLPEINEKNCNSGLAETITDKAQRSNFIDLCARRNSFKPSPTKTW